MSRGFTVVEMLIVVMALLILATSAIIGYNRVIENAREKVTRNNLLGLAAAVEVYALENDALPATLGMLLPEHIEKGFARVRQKENRFSRGARLLTEWAGVLPAFAQDDQGAPFFSYETLKKYGANEEMFECPGPGDAAPVYYAVNGNLKGMNWKDIRDGVVLIAECTDDFPEGFGDTGDLAARWDTGILPVGVNRQGAAIVILKNKNIVKDNPANLAGNIRP